ncbi:MAG: hypothetical protein ACJ76A_06915 [Actinomycetota bacterium]
MTMAGASDPRAQPPPRERRWLPVVIVTMLLLVVAGGARSVADATATTAGPVAMGPVRVQPTEGWQVDGSVTPSFVRLHKGPVVLDITVGQPVAGGPVALAALYREQQLEPAFSRLLPGLPEPAVLPTGVPAAGFAYLAARADGVVLDGRVVAADAPNAAVIFDVRAPTGELTGVIEDVRTMIDGATL